MAKIDIRTAIVQPSQTFWAMHAGGGRKFAPFFRGQSKLFLELAGVRLSSAILADVGRLRQHVRLGEAVVQYHSDRANDRPTDRPSRDPDQYSDRPGRSLDSGLNARVGNVHTLFVSVKRGDIVFVPISLGGGSHVLAGEVLDDFNPQQEAKIDLYPGDFVPARQVSWIGDPIPRRAISEELSLRLSNRHTIIQLASEFRQEAISHVFRNVAIDGSSQTIINGSAYDGKRITDIIDAIDLLNRNLFLTTRVDAEGRVAALSEVLPLNRQEAAAILEVFALEFSSPGSFRIATKGMARAALLIALLLCLSSDIPQKELTNVQVTNSLAPRDSEMTPQVEEQVRGLMKMIPPKEFKSLRDDSKRSTEQIRLNVDGRVTP